MTLDERLSELVRKVVHEELEPLRQVLADLQVRMPRDLATSMVGKRKLVCAQVAADYMSLSVRTVRTMVYEGRLHNYGTKRALRVDLNEVENLPREKSPYVPETDEQMLRRIDERRALRKERDRQKEARLAAKQQQKRK